MGIDGMWEAMENQEEKSNTTQPQKKKWTQVFA